MTVGPPLALTHPPSPYAKRVALWQVAFGIVAGPAAWFVQVCAGEALASEPCFPDGHRYLAPAAGLSWTWPALIALLVLCALVAFAAFLLAWRVYQAIRTESGGEAGGLLDEGAGRSRFMALWGMLYGGGFCLITLFTLAAYGALPRCAG